MSEGENMDRMFHVKHCKRDDGGDSLSSLSLNWESSEEG